VENVPFCRWHTKARIIMGSATFFDAFDALAIAFVIPVLVGLWHLNHAQIGLLIAAGYLGQVIGALLFGSLAERFGRVPSAAVRGGNGLIIHREVQIWNRKWSVALVLRARLRYNRITHWVRFGCRGHSA
jgi:MFS family permease